MKPVSKPMHLQPVFDCGLAADTHSHTRNGQKRVKARVLGGAVSKDLFERGLCLPSGTAMTQVDLDRVISAIRNAGPTT